MKWLKFFDTFKQHIRTLLSKSIIILKKFAFNPFVNSTRYFSTTTIVGRGVKTLIFPYLFGSSHNLFEIFHNPILWPQFCTSTMTFFLEMLSLHKIPI